MPHFTNLRARDYLRRPTPSPHTHLTHILRDAFTHLRHLFRRSPDENRHVHYLWPRLLLRMCCVTVRDLPKLSGLPNPTDLSAAHPPLSRVRCPSPRSSSQCRLRFHHPCQPRNITTAIKLIPSIIPAAPVPPVPPLPAASAPGAAAPDSPPRTPSAAPFSGTDLRDAAAAASARSARYVPLAAECTRAPDPATRSSSITCGSPFFHLRPDGAAATEQVPSLAPSTLLRAGRVCVDSAASICLSSLHGRGGGTLTWT